MTAQKGFFNRVPSHSVYPIDMPAANQLPTSTRSHQGCISAVIAVCGLLILLIIVAVVAFVCWKAANNCDTCDSESEKSLTYNNIISEPDFLDGLFSNEDDQATKSSIVTTMKPETSVRAPPRAPVGTTTSVPNNDVVTIEEGRRPWYARLPLIGWMFQSSEFTEERVTKISIN